MFLVCSLRSSRRPPAFVPSTPQDGNRVFLAASVYRAHNPHWAFAPTSGDGAARYGGRFNPPGVPALYTSLSLETAWFEAQQGFAFKAQPLTICAYEVDCADVIDLTDADTRLARGVTGAELACAWEDRASRGVEPASWRIAKSLIAGRFAGLIAPSFALGAGPGARNAVFWTWSDTPPHKVTVIDD